MREAASTLIADWRERGRELGFGAGIAQGYATLGQIGFSERSGYTAIGTVCNVAARLCAEAKDGQILLGQRVNVALKGSVATEQLGALALKGLTPACSGLQRAARGQPTGLSCYRGRPTDRLSAVTPPLAPSMAALGQVLPNRDPTVIDWNAPISGRSRCSGAPRTALRDSDEWSRHGRNVSLRPWR
jgi:hypothetical protein